MITITIILEERDESVTVRCEAKSEPPNPGTKNEMACADKLLGTMMNSDMGMKINSRTEITFDT